MNTTNLEKIKIDFSSNNKSYYEKYCSYLKEIEENIIDNNTNTYDFQGTSNINYERYVETHSIKR